MLFLPVAIAALGTWRMQQADRVVGDMVGIAIREMDEVTRQNAALVGQAAAAAQSMQNQAARLRQVVGVFKLAQLPIQAAQPAPIRRPAKSAKTVSPDSALAPVVPSGVARHSRSDDDWEEF